MSKKDFKNSRKAKHFQLYISEKGVQHVKVYTTSEKTYFYDNGKHRTSQIFACGRCRARNKWVSARLTVDKNGKESFILGKAEHICVPFDEDERDQR